MLMNLIFKILWQFKICKEKCEVYFLIRKIRIFSPVVYSPLTAACELTILKLTLFHRSALLYFETTVVIINVLSLLETLSD